MLGDITIVLGRSAADCDVRLADEAVSRKHLALTWHSMNQIKLVDLGSSHGSFFWNGEKWQQFSEVTLSANDYIYIGNAKLRLMEVLIAYQIKRRSGINS